MKNKRNLNVSKGLSNFHIRYDLDVNFFNFAFQDLLLEASWVVLDASWAALETSWAVLEASWAILGAS